MPAKGEGFILGMQGMLARWMGDGNEVIPLVALEKDIIQNRTNDGAIDPFGNVWNGTMRWMLALMVVNFIAIQGVN